MEAKAPVVEKTTIRYLKMELFLTSDKKTDKVSKE
jgi:hypothetical protein